MPESEIIEAINQWKEKELLAIKAQELLTNCLDNPEITRADISSKLFDLAQRTESYRKYGTV